MLSLSEVSTNDIGTYTCTAEFSNKKESSAVFYVTQTSKCNLKFFINWPVGLFMLLLKS